MRKERGEKDKTSTQREKGFFLFHQNKSRRKTKPHTRTHTAELKM